MGKPGQSIASKLTISKRVATSSTKSCTYTTSCASSTNPAATPSPATPSSFTSLEELVRMITLQNMQFQLETRASIQLKPSTGSEF